MDIGSPGDGVAVNGVHVEDFGALGAVIWGCNG